MSLNHAADHGDEGEEMEDLVDPEGEGGIGGESLEVRELELEEVEVHHLEAWSKIRAVPMSDPWKKMKNLDKKSWMLEMNWLRS